MKTNRKTGIVLCAALLFASIICMAMLLHSRQKDVPEKELSSNTSIRYELPNFLPAVWTAGS